MLCFDSLFNDTATTKIYALALHDALPISECRAAYAAAVEGATDLADKVRRLAEARTREGYMAETLPDGDGHLLRSEEHTSELQSRHYLVCRLLLEKKKTPLNRVASLSQSF